LHNSPGDCARELFKPVMESRDPFLRVSVLKVSGLVSILKVSGLETLNIAKKWFIKIFKIQRFFVCCICR